MPIWILSGPRSSKAMKSFNQVRILSKFHDWIDPDPSITNIKSSVTETKTYLFFQTYNTFFAINISCLSWIIPPNCFKWNWWHSTIVSKCIKTNLIFPSGLSLKPSSKKISCYFQTDQKKLFFQHTKYKNTMDMTLTMNESKNSRTCAKSSISDITLLACASKSSAVIWTVRELMAIIFKVALIKICHTTKWPNTLFNMEQNT